MANYFYCGVDLDESMENYPLPNSYTTDHITPVSRGGSRKKISNLLPACWSCNCKKRAKTLEEYRESLVATDPIGFVHIFLEKQSKNLGICEDDRRIIFETTKLLTPRPVVTFWGERASALVL